MGDKGKAGAEADLVRETARANDARVSAQAAEIVEAYIAMPGRSAAGLARLSGVSVPTLKRLRKGSGSVTVATLCAILAAAMPGTMIRLAVADPEEAVRHGA